MTFGLVALALVVATALVTATVMNRRLRRLADASQQLVRDPKKRLPTASVGGPARDLSQWLNTLADEVASQREALQRERTLLGSVADGLTQGVIALDGERRIEMLNEAARKMIGAPGTMITESLLELVRVPELRLLVEDSRDATAEIQLPNGPRALIRVARTYGRPGCVLLLEDVTAMRRLETVRRDFVANVSHELRTPVAVIRANAETLLAGAKDDPVMAGKLIDGLHRNAERLARILADLLDLSRLDAGQYRLDITAVSVRSIAEQSLSAVDNKRGIAVEIDVPDGLGVRADAKALDQILVNLIDNGCKYGGTHVWVHATDLTDAVRIEIRDDGAGLAEKHRARVFERFYRADPSRSREAGGTGLGLSIVKHLVESMGGAVGVEPNSPRGSIFWLQLPKAQTQVAA
ncbi:MAG: PAS domain-containing protein [Deltaproteobacteria bacterium]|nr:PAS domain-containing protein [Deltaproteobacteria bacterium]